MLRVKKRHFDLVDAIETPGQPEGVREFGWLLQQLLRLEHATIPPYLTAAFSLDSSLNGPIQELILRVAKEEMLHMTVIANLMIAIGVRPRFDDPEFVPRYPVTLPLLETDGWRIHLRSFSQDPLKCKALVEDTFMRIERAEKPRRFPDLDEPPSDEPSRPDLSATTARQDVPDTHTTRSGAPRTIGALYDRLIDAIESDRIPALFANTHTTLHRQLTTSLVEPMFRSVRVKVGAPPHDYPLPIDIDFKIDGKDAAVRHLRWIVEQGEGTDTQPRDAQGLPAHYYRFESIIYEEYLIQDPDWSGDERYAGGFSFSGAPLQLNLEGVHEFDTNADPEDYSGGLKRAMMKFESAYTAMLRALQAAFDADDPAHKRRAYSDSLQRMRELARRAGAIKRKAASDPTQGGGGLSFRFRPTREEE